MSNTFRCNCPITSAIDILCDRWSLVIVKQMLVEHYQTFKDFVEGPEKIASNILSSRLKKLQEFDLIAKNSVSTNKRTSIYKLTEKGLTLTSIIVEMALWSDTHLRQKHEPMLELPELAKSDKHAFIQHLQESYRNL